MATKHSNWRDDLREVVDSDSEDQNDNEIKEKKVKNKIDINPSIKESIESIGGQLIDIRKISEGKYEDCDCKGCGDDGVGHQNPCVECGGHHKEENEVDEDYDLVQKQRRQDAEARKHVARKETRKKAVSKVKNVVKGFLGKKETEVYEATGRWVDSKGRSHTFSFDTNIVDHEYIKDLVKSRYPAKRIFIKTDKVKSKKKKAEKKVEKESFSNWRDEIVECGGHHKDKMSEGEMVVSEGETAAQKKRRLEVAKKEAKKKIRAIGPLKKADHDGDGWIRVIDAEYEPEGEMVENLTSLKATTYGMPHEKRKAILDKYRKSEKNRGTDTKKGRDAGAIARERLNKEENEVKEDATSQVNRVLKGIEKDPRAQKSFEKSAKKRKGPGTDKDRAADLKFQSAIDAADTSKSDSSYAYEEVEFAVDYFYEQGINEDGLDLIIEEIGLDDFVEFVLYPDEELMEERAARKMNVKTKKKMPATIASDAEAEAKRRAGKTGEYKETPKKKAKVGGPSYTTKVEGPVKKMEKRRADDDLAGAPVKKKVEKAVAKVKPIQPKKEVSKGGLRDKIDSLYKAGVKRHKKAVQPARVFAKGFKRGVTDTVKFAKKAKKAVVGEGREDRDPPEQFEKGDDERGNPDYMKSVSYADEKKWERLQRMRKASKKKVSKEEKNWIQKAVKRPGAFTAKANKHDMSVQGFAKYVDDNPKKFDTRTKRQANLAQTFASMKKEDVDEMIEILGEVLLEG